MSITVDKVVKSERSNERIDAYDYDEAHEVIITIRLHPTAKDGYIHKQVRIPETRCGSWGPLAGKR